MKNCLQIMKIKFVLFYYYFLIYNKMSRKGRFELNFSIWIKLFNIIKSQGSRQL